MALPTGFNDAQFMIDVREGNVERVTAVLAGSPEASNVTVGGDPVLCQAAYKGHRRLVMALLDAGADIEARDSDGDTPLRNACLGKHHDIVDLLVERGAQIDPKTELYFRFERQPEQETQLPAPTKSGGGCGVLITYLLFLSGLLGFAVILVRS